MDRETHVAAGDGCGVVEGGEGVACLGGNCTPANGITGIGVKAVALYQRTFLYQPSIGSQQLLANFGLWVAKSDNSEPLHSFAAFTLTDDFNQSAQAWM